MPLALRESMELAGRSLVQSLAGAGTGLPCFGFEIAPGGRARCLSYWPSHNVGRWWDALLRLEAATGFSIPGPTEEGMARAMRACLENPLGVCCYLEPREGLPDGPDPAGWFDNHSQREALLGLAAIVRWRGFSWARELGDRMVDSLDRLILSDGRWDIPSMAVQCRGAGVEVPQALVDFYDGMQGFRLVESHGRLIEALLEYALAAGGSQQAMDLAGRLSRWHLEHSTRPDGTVPPAEHTHTHSLLGTFRGLLLYGQLTGQQEYVDRVAALYAVTVRRACRRSGFVSHDLWTEKDGETGSLGDVIQLALWLARAGSTALFDDAERLVRSRLLPSQVTERPGLTPDDLDDRVLGGFGGMHLYPHGGKQPYTDITAADLHALCDVYTHVVEETPDGLRVNFHFDYEDARLSIRSVRDQAARLELRLRQPTRLLVRIPAWTPPGSLRLTMNGRELPAVVTRGWLDVPRAEAGGRIDVAYGLPTETTIERTDGVDYTLRWRGDEITGITPNTGWLPFYPTAHGS